MKLLKNKWTAVLLLFAALILASACSMVSGFSGADKEAVPGSEEVIMQDGDVDQDPIEEENSASSMEADPEEWREPIGYGLYVLNSCEALMEITEEVDTGADTGFEAFEAIILTAVLLDAADEGIASWDPGDLAEYKLELEESSEQIKEVIINWFDESIEADQASRELEPICAAVEETFSGIQGAAKAAGVSDAALAGLMSELTIEMETLMAEGMTDAPLEEEIEEQAETAEGMSRNNPFPAGSRQVVPNWEIQVLDSNRGEEAWQMIESENMFNDPAPEGKEYINLYVYVKCLYDDDDEHSISSSDFRLTGSNLVQYGWNWVVSPSPQLDASVYSSGEAEGWISFLIDEGEDNLILVFDEWSSWDDDRYRYFAVDEGASVGIPGAVRSAEADEQGLSRSDPAPFGVPAATGEWKLQVQEVIRGDEAWNMLQAANSFNDPPEAGMEYVLVYLRVQSLNLDEAAQGIDGMYFSMTGDRNTVHESVYLSAPEPVLDAYLYPGGEAEGWIVLQASEGETGLKLVFEPWMSFDPDVRYLSLEE